MKLASVKSLLPMLLGILVMILLSRIILALISDATFASILIGIIGNFVANAVSALSETKPQGISLSLLDQHRVLGNVWIYLYACCALLVAWLFTLECFYFINAHLNMLVSEKLVTVEPEHGGFLLEYGFISLLSVSCFFPMIFLLSGFIGLLSGRKVFHIFLLASLSTIFIYYLGNLFWQNAARDIVAWRIDEDASSAGDGAIRSPGQRHARQLGCVAECYSSRWALFGHRFYNDRVCQNSSVCRIRAQTVSGV